MDLTRHVFTMLGTTAKKTSLQNGFTLIELLVALTIFSVLSAAGWQVFDQLQKTRTRVSEKSEQISRLQYAYMQFNTDINQFVNRVGYSLEMKDVKPTPGLDEAFSIGLDVYLNQLSFTKRATPDPRYIGSKQPIAKQIFERVTFKLKDEKLMRYSSKFVDNKNVKALPAVLLNGVKNLKIRALDPSETATWPPEDGLENGQTDSVSVLANTDVSDENILQEVTQLPLGVLVSFDYLDTPVVWRFALVKPLPNTKKPKPDKKATNNATAQNNNQTNANINNSGNTINSTGNNQSQVSKPKQTSNPAKIGNIL